MSEAPKLFRITIEVANLDHAAALYTELLGIPGKRHPGARHYYDCGGVIVAVLDVSRGGMPPPPGPKSHYFAVDDVAAVHARATKLAILAPWSTRGATISASARTARSTRNGPCPLVTDRGGRSARNPAIWPGRG